MRIFYRACTLNICLIGDETDTHPHNAYIYIYIHTYTYTQIIYKTSAILSLCLTVCTIWKLTQGSKQFRKVL